MFMETAAKHLWNRFHKILSTMHLPFTIVFIFFLLGMSVNNFQGLQDVLEVECSSERVETYFDVFTVSLFLLKNDKILAFVSPKSRECTTSSYFSACVVDSVNPRLSRVKTLLVDLPEGHTESFGCNVTSLNPQRRFVTTSWSLDVRKESE